MIKVYRSSKLNKLSQGFGENKACAAIDFEGGMIRPAIIVGTHNPGVCPIGFAPFYQLMIMDGHNGRDWSLPIGSPLHHSRNFDGFAKTEIDLSGGLGVDVVSKEPVLECTEGCKPGTMHHVKARYWHLSVQSVYDGKPVSMGDFIGKSGNTGASSGPHLHESTKWCDPFGNGLHTSNGFRGAINDTAWLTNKFVVDHINDEKINVQIVEAQMNVIELLKQWIAILAERVMERVSKGR